MSAGLSGSSKYSRVAFFVLIVNGLLLIISYASPFWTTTDNGYAGLWISCNWNQCYERWNLWVAGWIHAVQFMMSIALTGWAFTLLFLFVYIFHRRFDEDKRLVFLATIAIFISATTTLLSVVTWAAGQSYASTEMLNWAYILSCFVTFGSFFVFFVLLVELRNIKR